MRYVFRGYRGIVHSPAIVKEKPVLEALKGVKQSSQIAKEVEKTVPAKLMRVVIQLQYNLCHLSYCELVIV